MRPDLYVEVQMFYADQMPLLEEGRPEEFAATYTDDAVIEHVSGLFKLNGRQVAGSFEDVWDRDLLFSGKEIECVAVPALVNK